MKRVLITGMSGTGKSTVIERLAALGYAAVDTDSDAWCEWVLDEEGERDWVWREECIGELLDRDDGDVLFVSGCKSNQGRFYPRFDHVILLSAPASTIVERLATRTNNPYGKSADELADVLRYLETVEPLLRRGATLELDTRVPVEEVVAAILAHVEERGTA